jgi:hypothetical protein
MAIAPKEKSIADFVKRLAAQTELTDRGRFELPINPGSKLRLHRD